MARQQMMNTAYPALSARLVVATLLAGSLLGGCATRQEPLYHWGGYQTQVYGHFTGDKGPEEQIEALEADAEKARSKGKALPPGYQAHLAMLYGKTGRTEQLRANLEAEKAQFPESATFMDFLLQKFKP